MQLGIKRGYEKPKENDGVRILVDRLWPRGLKKKEAKVDKWLKEIAPSNSLRKLFSHDPEKWTEFKKRYFKELEEKKEDIEEMFGKIKKQTITFLYATKEQKYNNAAALKEYVEKRWKMKH